MPHPQSAAGLPASQQIPGVSKSFFHENLATGKDEWLTPKWITDALGPFDLDPCSPVERPWPTAECHFTEQDNGLLLRWSGMVWCNPPYNNSGPWLEKCAEHDNAIVLIYARTETGKFFESVWPKASCIVFMKGRLTFLNRDGSKPKFTGGGPSCLIGYGETAFKRLDFAVKNGVISGKFINLNSSDE